MFLLLEIDRLRKLDVVQDQVTALDETVRSRISGLDDTLQAQVARLDETVQAQVARLDTGFQAHLAKLDIDTVAQQLKQENYLGVIRVHGQFPDEQFNAFVEGATQEVAILQTFIPNLEQLQPSLEKALVDQRIPVRVMLLHPSSPVAELRDEARHHRHPRTDRGRRRPRRRRPAAAGLPPLLGRGAGLRRVRAAVGTDRAAVRG